MKRSGNATIPNKLGLHARAAVLFVKSAGQFSAEIWVEKNGQRVNGKSIMGLLTLAASQGTKLKVIADGPDAEKAVQELVTLVESGFGEDE